MERLSYQYNNYSQNQIVQDIEKKVKFMERIAPFAEVQTLDEAKNLAKRILPTQEDITNFSIGDMKCTVVNRCNLLRITVVTDEEFVCYSFS